jgi:opacity protein-like surface antigen
MRDSRPLRPPRAPFDLRLGAHCLWTAWFVLLPAIGLAQTRSVLTGTVTIQDGSVLPDAVIVVASPSLPGGPVQVSAGSDGTWRVADLLPGVYSVAVSAPGYQTVERPDLRVSATGTTVVDTRLAVAGVAETVSVVGSRPLLDVRNAATVTTVDQQLLDALPLERGGTVFNFARALLPGITPTTAYGAYVFSIDHRVDGMTLNDARQGGTTAGPLFSVRWLEEAQYAGLGAAAEYGDALGGTANFTLRSGSERLNGEAEFSGTQQSWTSDNRGSLAPSLQQRFRPREIIEQWEGEGHVGGPLATNRVFFFSGYERSENATIPAGSLGIVPAETDRHRFVGKVHAVPSGPLRLEGAVVGSFRDAIAENAAPNVTPDAFNLNGDRLWQWNARVTWTPSGNTLVEGRISGLKVNFLSEPLPPNTRLGPPVRQDLVTGITSGNVSLYNTQWNNRYPVAAAVTHIVNRFGGSHVVKGGAEVERLTTRIEQGYPAGRLYQDRSGVPDQVLLWDGDVFGQTGIKTSLYIQDTWQVSRSVTLTPGVRVNINRASVANKGTVFRTTGVGPRFGLAWAPNGPESTVVRAAYGRVYEGLLGRMADFLDTTGQTPRITARVLGPDTFQELTRVTPATNFGIDDHLRHPFVDDWVAGVEQAIARSLSVRAQYAYRRFEDVLAFIDTGSVYEPVQRRDPGQDNIAGNADDGEVLTVYNLTNPGQSLLVLTNPDDARRTYHGLTLAADKRFSDNWQLLASYTWSRTRGAVSNSGDNVPQGETTGPSGSFANPNAAINGLTRAPLDYPHEIKLQGLYRLPYWGGATIGVNYQYLSGQPWGRRATITGLRQGNQAVRIEPRGTRRLDATNTINMHVEKTIRVGRTATGVYADIFNLANDGAATGVTDTSGGSFGVPSGWSVPRTLRMGVRISF